MPAGIGVDAWLASAYALVLLGVAYAIDAMARRASRSAQLSNSAGFTYHEDHDAWLCPQDQWLWPQSFDPDNRVMRYRGSPSVCNACPVKDTCTTSHSGREIARAVDPWPASEAARFHRGIACAVVVIALLWPLGTVLTGPGLRASALLLGVSLVVVLGGLPLFSHLRRSPASFPDTVRVASLDDNVAERAEVAAAQQRRRTRYGSDSRQARR